MVKTLLAQVKEYKKASLVTPVFMVLEVLMEILIPTLMALLIDNGVNKGNVRYVCVVGGIMVVIDVYKRQCSPLLKAVPVVDLEARLEQRHADERQDQRRGDDQIEVARDAARRADDAHGEVVGEAAHLVEDEAAALVVFLHVQPAARVLAPQGAQGDDQLPHQQEAQPREHAGLKPAHHAQGVLVHARHLGAKQRHDGGGRYEEYEQRGVERHAALQGAYK